MRWRSVTQAGNTASDRKQLLRSAVKVRVCDSAFRLNAHRPHPLTHHLFTYLTMGWSFKTFKSPVCRKQNTLIFIIQACLLHEYICMSTTWICRHVQYAILHACPLHEYAGMSTIRIYVYVHCTNLHACQLHEFAGMPATRICRNARYTNLQECPVRDNLGDQFWPVEMLVTRKLFDSFPVIMKWDMQCTGVFVRITGVSIWLVDKKQKLIMVQVEHS